MVELRDEAGRVVHRQEADLKATGPSGMARLELHPPAPAEGAYTFRVIVASSDSASITVEQPWWVISRRLARVQVGTDGYLIRGGQRIFPLGMFNNEARLAEEVEAGFNIVHFYNAARVRPGRRPDDQRLAEAMNKCARAGMHVLLLVPMEYAFAGEWEAFTRRIRMFRNHPALLAWDEEEGLARGDMTMEVLRRIREVLRREDPHHPFMVGDAHTVIDRVNDRSRMFPLDQMDLGMWWWYPFPLKRGGPTASRPDDALQGEQAGSGMLLEPPAFLNAPTDKPIWVGIQAYKKPGPNRYPTPAEYRAQAYLSVIAGAKGLMWPGGSVTGGAFLKPDEAHWPQLKQLVRELRDLEPLLLGASEPVRAIGPAGVGVSATVKQAGARRILIAVNRGPDVCNATFELPGLPAGTVEVVGESRRVAATVGEITDRFEPFAAHVYDLGRSLP